MATFKQFDDGLSGSVNQARNRMYKDAIARTTQSPAEYLASARTQGSLGSNNDFNSTNVNTKTGKLKNQPVYPTNGLSRAFYKQESPAMRGSMIQKDANTTGIQASEATPMSTLSRGYASSSTPNTSSLTFGNTVNEQLEPQTTGIVANAPERKINGLGEAFFPSRSTEQFTDRPLFTTAQSAAPSPDVLSQENKNTLRIAGRPERIAAQAQQAVRDKRKRDSENISETLSGVADDLTPSFLARKTRDVVTSPFRVAGYYLSGGKGIPDAPSTMSEQTLSQSVIDAGNNAPEMPVSNTNLSQAFDGSSEDFLRMAFPEVFIN